MVNCFKFFCIYCLLYSTLVYADLDDEGEEESSQLGVVMIEEDLQTSAGLQFQSLQRINFQSEAQAYGLVVDIFALINSRNDYFKALARLQIVKAKLTQSKQAMQRLRKLRQADGVSSRKFEQQQSQWRGHQAELDAARQHLTAIKETARFQWGKQISQWLFVEHSKNYQQLINHQLFLVEITLRTPQNFKDNQQIYIEANGKRQQASSANFVAIAPKINASTIGSNYFFLANNSQLRIGMTVTAWLPKQSNQHKGFIVPFESVVWHLGQAFVYIHSEDEEFTRRSINIAERTANGYFVEENLQEHEQLVINGAQMLLSEEFRGQIPDEDDD